MHHHIPSEIPARYLPRDKTMNGVAAALFIVGLLAFVVRLGQDGAVRAPPVLPRGPRPGRALVEPEAVDAEAKGPQEGARQDEVQQDPELGGEGSHPGMEPPQALRVQTRGPSNRWTALFR